MIRWRSRSLVARVTLLFGLTACLITGSLGAYFCMTASSSVDEHMDQQLVARVEHFRRVVADMPSVDQLAARPVLFEAMLGGERDVLIFRQRDQPPLIDVNPDHLPVPELTVVPLGRMAAMTDVHHLPLADGIPMLWVAAAARTGADGGLVEVVAGHPMHNEVQMLTRYRDRVILATLIAIVMSVLLAFMLLRGGLRPLRRVAEQAAEVNPINLAVRFDETDAPRELRTMTAAVNAMLDRIASGYQRLSQFSADLAHEIRTPIGALIGQTQVTLNQSRRSDEYQEVLESNLEELNRLRSIAENILFLARADHAGQPIERAPVDLRVELSKIADYFEGLADESDLRFDISARGQAWANPTLCQRAINNLVINAVRYSVPGTTLKLTGHEHVDGASIVVENHCAPIPADQLERLFDRFYRGDAARSRFTESSGLGLAIVKAIMGLHGGRAQVACPEVGVVRFELWFPRATPEFPGATLETR